MRFPLLCARLAQHSVISNSTIIRSLHMQKISSNFLRTSILSSDLIKQNLVSQKQIRESSTSHNHSKLWNLEKYLSGGLLAVIPAAFLVQCSVLDYALAVSLVTHVHWGFEAIAVDYVRPALFGEFIPKLAVGLVYVLSALSLAGLFYLNYNDVGLSESIKMIFRN